MKKNGFTLVELLAMLVILGIIMALAIPNISGMIQNQKLDLYKSDASSMVEAAKMKASKDKYMAKPNDGDCIVFSLNYLDDNENIITGPNGGDYDQFDSVVVFARTGDKYKYYVRLVENYKNKRIGIHLLDSANINSLKTRDIGEIGDNIGLLKTDRGPQGVNKIKIFASITAYCTRIKSYYSGGNYCYQNNGIYYDNDGNVVTAEQYNESCT